MSESNIRGHQKRPAQQRKTQTREEIVAANRQEAQQAFVALADVFRKLKDDSRETIKIPVEMLEYLFPWLKNFIDRADTAKYLPLRQEMIDFVTYLGYPIEVTNNVLVAAGYQPMQLPVSGAALGDALAIRRKALDELPYPGVMINRDWRMYGYNTFMERLWQLNPTEKAYGQDGKLTMLHAIFDTHFGLRQRLSITPGDWRSFAKLNVFAWLMENHLAQRDAWFTSIVKDLRESYATDFIPIWEEIQRDLLLGPVSDEHPQSFTAPLYTFQITTKGHAIAIPDVVTIQPLRILMGDLNYPIILCHKPYDSASVEWFRQNGLLGDAS